MDNALRQALENLNQQNEILGKARNEYLLFEAQRKHFEGVLVQGSTGKSMAEKTSYAQSSKEWEAFHSRLARLEAVYEFQKLKYEILDKVFQAEYLSLKLDSSTIKRQL